MTELSAQRCHSYLCAIIQVDKVEPGTDIDNGRIKNKNDFNMQSWHIYTVFAGQLCIDIKI